MSSHVSHSNEYAFYFITFTCYQWLHLFKLTNSYDVVYKWFDYIKGAYSIKTTAYVIMPNHVHCILFFPSSNYDLNKLVSNGKRFIAYDIVKRLQQDEHHDILLRLKEGLTERHLKKGQLHKVFEDSFDAKPILSQTIFTTEGKLHTLKSGSRHLEVGRSLGRL